MTYPFREEILAKHKLSLTLPQDLKNVHEKPAPKTTVVFEVVSLVIMVLVFVVWIIVATAFLTSHSPAKAAPTTIQKGGEVHAYGTDATWG